MATKAGNRVDLGVVKGCFTFSSRLHLPTMKLRHDCYGTLTVRTTCMLAALFAAAPVSAASLTETAPGWIATVRGAAVSAPAFPGSNSYSFVSLPSMNLRQGSARTAHDDSKGLWGPGSRGDIGVLSGSGGMSMPASPFDTTRPALNPGVFAEFWADPGRVRLRAEARFDTTGQSAPTAALGADYVQRVGPNAVVSGGPRLNFAGQDYVQTAYGVTPLALGGDVLAGAYRAETGVRSVGAAAALNVDLSPGLSTTVYANYDRMVGQPADERVQRGPSMSPNRFSFGAQMNYTFGTGR